MIQTFLHTRTNIADGNLILGIVLLLKPIISFNIVPEFLFKNEDQYVQVFPCPVSLIETVLTPVEFIVWFYTMSEFLGISSVLAICDNGKLCSL